MNYNTAFISENHQTFNLIFPNKKKQEIKNLSSCFPILLNKELALKYKENLKSVKYLFSTWGMPELSEKEIKLCFPKIRHLFYAAGSIKRFAKPFLNSDIKVHSAWGANAVPVAEYTVSQIILANKGFFLFSSLKNHPSYRNRKQLLNNVKKYPGNFNSTVSLLGAGMIGKKVIKLLANYNLNIQVFDPFLSKREAKELNVSKVELKEAFETSFVISNHLADIPETEKIIKGEFFNIMLPQAIFINTARGKTVEEDKMIEILKKRTDIYAILDVTFPEPPLDNSPLYNLPNVLLTPHIAGSIGNEVIRMTDYMIKEFKLVLEGKDGKYSINKNMLKTMA